MPPPDADPPVFPIDDVAVILLIPLLLLVVVALLFSVLLQLLPLLIRRCILTVDPLLLPLLMAVPDESDSLYLVTPPTPLVLGFNVADEDEPEQR